MCCFAQEVKDVHSTKIFARITEDGQQVLAYSMKYDSEVPNAMILPLPTTGREDSLEFIDLSGYERFFDDLQRGFPKVQSLLSRALPMARVDSAVKQDLKVHKVGSFVASFVPTVKDFSRLDPQFVIPAETWQSVDGYDGFGFAVFQLDEKAGKTHPMAMRFETSLKDQVFFPTLHIHDGEIHKSEKFDHYLFMQHAGMDSVVGSYAGPKKTQSRTGMVRSKNPVRDFAKPDKSAGLLEPDLLLHRKRMSGNLPNRDEIFRVAGHPTKVSFNIAPWLKIAPMALAATGLAWIIGRRTKLLREAKK
ncbi:MAG TPA: hypothetical protein DDW52_24670 [Planctomycetaceae bacterium]|nr:hypothetical protein [Planctomycetaceae bacterium]